MSDFSSDSDYEVPNVEQENNEKDVEGLFTVTRSGSEQQQTEGILSMGFTK